jgi:hypothetical protein
MFLVLLPLGLSRTFVVFDKKLTAMQSKVGDPVTVLYNVYNFGDTRLTDLRVDDSGIPLELWNFPKSANNVRWSALDPGTNLSFAFPATPLIPGMLRMESARLKYLVEGEKRIAYSSKPVYFFSKATRSIGARANLLPYAAVVGASLAAILFPLLLWILTRPKAVAPGKTKTN